MWRRDALRVCSIRSTLLLRRAAGLLHYDHIVHIAPRICSYQIRIFPLVVMINWVKLNARMDSVLGGLR